MRNKMRERSRAGGLLSRESGSTCHQPRLHLATDARHLARTLLPSLLLNLMTLLPLLTPFPHIWTGGVSWHLTMSLTVSAIQQGHNKVWHFSAPSDMSSDKNISQVACLRSPPAQNVDILPVTAPPLPPLNADMRYWTFCHHTFSYCPKYICLSMGNFEVTKKVALLHLRELDSKK